MVGELERVGRDCWPVPDVGSVWTGYLEAPVEDLREVCERPPVIQGNM